MPVYEYYDTTRGETVELVKPVAERDLVPPNLRRITVPQRVALHGTSSSPLDDESADAQVPAALKALSNREADTMCRESGMPLDKYRKTWGL